MMNVGDLFRNTKGEAVKVVKVDLERKTCAIEGADGKVKDLSISTLKDKRRWVPVDNNEPVEDPKEMSDQEWEDSAKPKIPEMVPMPVNQKAAEEHIKQIQEDFHSDEPAPKKKARKPRKQKMIEYNGKELTLHGWAAELGIPFGTLYARINRFHWTVEEAFTGVKNK